MMLNLHHVLISQIGYESHTFYKEEIDEQLVPPFVLDHLEEPFQTESASYTDAEGNYYLVIQVDIAEPQPYEVWLMKGVVVENFACLEDIEAKRKIDEENRNLIDGLTNELSNPANADLNALRLNVDAVVNSLIEQARATSAAAQLLQQEALMNASLRNQMQQKEQEQLLAVQKTEELKRKLEEQKRATEEAKKQQEDRALQIHLAKLTELQRQAFLQRQQQISPQISDNDETPAYTPEESQGGDGENMEPSLTPGSQPKPEPGNPDCPDKAENEECEGKCESTTRMFRCRRILRV